MSHSDNALKGIDLASLLLFAAGQKRASEVLKFLKPGEVEKIGAHMVSMRNFSPDTVDDALDEFFAAVNKHKALGVDSEEYVHDIFCNAFGDDKAKFMIDRISVGGKGRGINQLYGLDTRSIADLLRTEHPQVVANVLSLLEGERAADVLLCLPEDFRADVLMRIASLEGVSLAALRDLDEILEEQLAGNENIRYSSVGGIHVAANILNRMEGPVSSCLLDEIAENSPELAQKIQNKMYVFEDIINLDDRGMQTLLREIATDRLLLALRGVSDALKNKIFNSLSKRAAEMLREDLDAAPSAKLSDVELAQKEILIIVRSLADAGAIAFGGGDDQLI